MTEPAPADELKEVIEAANEQLAKEGARSAEQSFGLGCTLIALPALIVIAVLFVSGAFNLIMALIALVLSLLLVTGFSALIAISARNRTLRNTYEKSVEPDLARYLKRSKLSRLALDHQAHEILPAGAPLLPFCAPAQAELPDEPGPTP